jgi:hypothetical protein
MERVMADCRRGIRSMIAVSPSATNRAADGYRADMALSRTSGSWTRGAAGRLVWSRPSPLKEVE